MVRSKTLRGARESGQTKS